MKFGPYTWIILKQRDGKALLLAEDIIERRSYNEDWEATTWETCALRKYLNGEFLDRFTPEDRAHIALTHNENPDNTWGRTQGEPFNTPGGNATDDYVFLLSVEEVLKYFPGLKLHKDGDGDEWWYDADNRLATKFNGNRSWWWLRSPGYTQDRAAYVDGDGHVFLSGNNVDYSEGGVRPALRVNLKSGGSSNPYKEHSDGTVD
jgi:hypothetical protein